MSWEGGVDLVAMTDENLPMPNVIVHIARTVHTPDGSAAAGMIRLPNADGTTQIMGFVSTDKEIGDYFGANIFAGTPFENAPTIVGEINVEMNYPHSAKVTVKVANHEIVMELSDLGEVQPVNRQSPNLPFHEAAFEAEAGAVSLIIDGEKLNVIVPPVGMSGGPAAVFSPAGMYSR
jgi:hypothetical protein